jgi:iron complex outermembrane receptor protein
MFGEVGLVVWIGLRVCIGMRRAAVASLGALLFTAVAQAQGTSAPVPQQQERQFEIPPQPLASAIAQFGRQSDLQVSVGAAIIEGIDSPGVLGRFTPEQALIRLLAGTGITYRFTSSDTAMLERIPDGAVTLAPLTVEGYAVNPSSTMTPMPEYAGGQVATGGQLGLLGNKDVMDTPFSQTNYTNKTIKDQQAQTVQEVLSNDPSVVMNTNSGGSDYGFVTFRGFRDSSESGSGSLNGLAGLSPLRAPDMDYVERVEVLRGPSALLNGMAASGGGGLGGSYNLVTKQAGDEPLTELTARYSAISQFGTHLDVGRRFGTENQFGVRVNGAFRRGDTTVDPTAAEVGSAALNLDYSGESVRVSADIALQWDSASPRNMQMLGIGDFIPDAPDAEKSLSPSWSYGRERSVLGMVRGEFDITDDVTAYAAFGMQTWDYSTLGPIFVLDDASGNISPFNVARHRVSYDGLSAQAGIRARATTGPVDHALSFNLSHSEREAKDFYAQGTYSQFTNLYDLDFGPKPSVDDGDPKKASETRVSSIGLADTLSILDERIQFIAGIRYQEVDSTNFDTTTGDRTSDYLGKAWTPALGLVVKPWENVSLYANYIENLEAGTIVSEFYANAGEVFPPYVSEQYEAGVKVDWGKVTTTLAAFQITQPSTISVDDPGGGLPTLSLDGEQRNRGIELNAYGEPMTGVRLMGGLTLLDARRTKTADGRNDGDRAFGAPAIRAVLGGEWDTPFLEGLTLTGRLSHTGDQAVSGTIDGLEIPSWTVVDLGARYVFDAPWNDEPITVRFNVDNAFGEDYWSTAYYDLLFLGAPRTYRLSTTFKF